MDDRAADGRVVIGAFEFDRRTGELRRSDAAEPAARLGPQPAALLTLLIDHHGTVVTHDEIRRMIADDRKKSRPRSGAPPRRRSLGWQLEYLPAMRALVWVNLADEDIRIIRFE